jgi:hypothetical protein
MIDPRSTQAMLLCARALAWRAAGSWAAARVVVTLVRLASRRETDTDITIAVALVTTPIGTPLLALALSWIDLQRNGEWRWYRLLGISALQLNVLLLTMVVVLDRLLAPLVS